MIKETLGLLGKYGTDKITGFEGVITSVSFDLYGCVQAVLNPGLDNDGKLRDSHWFDVNRIDVHWDKVVMASPDFDGTDQAPENYDHGPAEKPRAMKV